MPVNKAYREAFSEYIELTNIESDIVSLDNWTIQKNSGSAVISGVILVPNNLTFTDDSLP